MLTETEKAYLAGFFDGDGCVNIAVRQGKNALNPSHYLQVIFSQCDQPFLERWCQKLGMGTTHKNARPANPAITATKELWHWRLYDRQAESILRMMLPYLDIKHGQAEIAIKFMDTKGTGGRRGIPSGTLRLREYYKQALHSLKVEEAESPPELQEYERVANSQLCLF